ncbi:MAG: peptidoglycan-binding protein [Bacillota bacterium]
MLLSKKRWLLLMVICLFAASYSITSAAAPLNCLCEEDDRILRLTNPLTTGSDVEELQSILSGLGFYRGELNGTYDQETASAVEALQAFAQLPVTGTFGPKEQEALTMSLAESSLQPSTPSPPEGELRLVIDVNAKTLTVLVNDVVFKVYPCAVGTSKTKSPVGEWRVIQKGTHWGGGFGTRWMGLNVPWGIYGIHGTNKPSSIGTAASHGCIRMHNRDVEQLYPWVKIGTKVSIVGPFPRVKVNRPLGLGLSGHEVQTLQLVLREAGFNPGSTDGRYGPDTAEAIRALQEFYGLRPTGQADWNVLTILGLR